MGENALNSVNDGKLVSSIVKPIEGRESNERAQADLHIDSPSDEEIVELLKKTIKDGESNRKGEAHE